MVMALLGSAWRENAKEAPHRTYFNVRLELGVVGVLSCRVVENTKRTSDKAPTHHVFYSPVAGGEDVRFGAFWPYRHPESGAEYLLGHVMLGKLGVVELKGGAKIDFRLVNDRIGLKLVEVRERTNEKGPTHQLWLVRPRGRARAASPTGDIADSAEPAAAPSSDEEILDAEMSDNTSFEV